jgi:hypothetical protein
MGAWFTSNLILTAIIAPTVSFLAVNSMYEITTWNRIVQKFAQPAFKTCEKFANDLTYEVKVRSHEAAVAQEQADAEAANLP